MTIQNRICDLILDNVKELRMLFLLDEKTIKANKNRAFSDINCIRESLNELEDYLKRLEC
jgi:predicted enzyme involved in methoxymalonyl-ACP biosynthesis